MAHPDRAEIFRILNDRAATPAEVARELNLPTGRVSYHMKRLCEMDCAELVYERKAGPSIEHVYKATTRSVIEAHEWGELSSGEAEGLVAEFMQAILDDFRASAAAKMIGLDPDFHLTRKPLVFDAEGLQEGLAATKRCMDEMDEIAVRSLGRRSRGSSHGASFHVSSSFGLFKMPQPGKDSDAV